jgi:hypothetical protein
VERSDPSARAHPADPPTRLTGRSAVKLHLTLVLGLALCGTAFSIEVVRALDGNSLSWMYVFEWPLFAGFAVYMWWKLLHDVGPRPSFPDAAGRAAEAAAGAGGATAPGGVGAGGGAGEEAGDGEDADLVAWNRYLQALAESDAAVETAEDRPPDR